jgi:GWxTD domain-containing protein
MLKRNLVIWFCAVSVAGFSQSIASLNFRYLYDPSNEIDLPIKLIHGKDQLTVYYRLQVTGAQDDVKNYVISWERRESYVQKEGMAIPQKDSLGTSGMLSFPLPEKPWLLVARIVNPGTNKRWTYFQVMESKYPVNGFIKSDGAIVFSPYIKKDREYEFYGSQADKPLHVFYYRSIFPPASPPFAEKGVSVDRFLFSDSTFNIANGGKAILHSPGLYLVQQDTSAAEGFTFRVVANAFPKLNKIEEIAPPLVFVSTKDEHDELLAAKNDKAKVDKVILDITGDTDRAKNFMKSYFRRIELTNAYFTSYKEGWKTDRGMLYLILGLPDEVSRTGQNEIWYYKATRDRFTFLKTGSIYEPQNYLLLRNNKFAANWYSTIDLWRKSRF